MTAPDHDAERARFDRRAIPAGAIESRWVAADGHGVRRIDWPVPDGEPRGSLLFLPGRGDAYEKYLETLAHWHAQGWQVTAADWRGQGGSGRLGFDPITGHVADFSVWVDDLAALWADWKQSRPGPHVIAAHSMGGHIVLRALAEQRIAPITVVLSAPMLGLRTRGVPRKVVHGLARLLAGLGDARRPAWQSSEKPGALPAQRITLLTHDAARYDDEMWWREQRPELVMGPGSWGWIERALASMRGLERAGVLEAITVPIFVVATKSDALVDYGAIARAAARLPRAELLGFGPEARHEILREEDTVRDLALGAINAFLDRTARVGG